MFSVNGITLCGSSLLHEAAETGDEAKVNRLPVFFSFFFWIRHIRLCFFCCLQPNVDVNGITLRGSSLLHEAAETGDEAKVNFLLAH